MDAGRCSPPSLRGALTQAERQVKVTPTMKGADKQKKGTKKPAQRSLKEKRQEKRAAKKNGG
jgi:hypothetical protein